MITKENFVKLCKELDVPESFEDLWFSDKADQYYAIVYSSSKLNEGRAFDVERWNSKEDEWLLAIVYVDNVLDWKWYTVIMDYDITDTYITSYDDLYDQFKYLNDLAIKLYKHLSSK